MNFLQSSLADIEAATLLVSLGLGGYFKKNICLSPFIRI